MVTFDNPLTLFDIMAQFGYIRTKKLHKNPQILDLRLNNDLYQFQLETFHLSELRKRSGSRKEHIHNVYHLVLFTEGDNSFLFEGKLQKCKPGTFVLTSPGQFHTFEPQRPGKVTYHELTFSLQSNQLTPLVELNKKIEDVLSCYSALSLKSTRSIHHLSSHQLNWLELYYQRIYEHLKDYKDYHWFFIHRIILDMMSFIIEEIYLPDLEVFQEKTDILVLIKDKIKKEFSKQISIKNYATQSSMSPEHFSRKFKLKFGLSPISYRTFIRIQTAKILLKTTNLQCKEIAERVGFSDIYSFSRSFKKSAEISPVTYRSSTI